MFLHSSFCLLHSPVERVLEGNPQYDGKMVTDLL